MKHFSKRFSSIWKLIIILTLLLLTFSYAMFQGGFVSWFLLFSFLPFCIYSIGIATYSLKEVKVNRVFNQQEFLAGERLQVSLLFKRKTFFPLFYIIIEEKLPRKLAYQQQMAKSIYYPYFKRDWRYTFTIDHLPRGEHRFDSIRIKTGGPLGLFEKEVEIKLEDKVIVYPVHVPIDYRLIHSRFDTGKTSSQERVQRDTTMAIGVREYQPGDRFSWINWKATARKNEIMTKEFEQRQSHDVMVMMNQGQHQAFEEMIVFTASLVKGILKKGSQIGFQIVGKDDAYLPINGGESQAQMILHYLAKVEEDSSVLFEKALNRNKQIAQQNLTIMLITGYITNNIVECAATIAAGQASVLIFLIKNRSEKPTQEENALLSKGKSRGVIIKVVHEGQFEDAFVEVAR